MHLRRARARLVVVALVLAASSSAAGCLSLNPARHPRPSDAELRVDGGRFYQGGTQLDEQDFYEVAGDKNAVRTIRNHRTALIGEQLGGQAAGAGGIGGVVVGGAGLAGGIVWTVQDGPIGLVMLIPSALLLTGSIVAIPVGYVAAAEAADELESGEPLLPLSRAKDAARRRNR